MSTTLNNNFVDKGVSNIYLFIYLCFIRNKNLLNKFNSTKRMRYPSKRSQKLKKEKAKEQRKIKIVKIRTNSLL